MKRHYIIMAFLLALGGREAQAQIVTGNSMFVDVGTILSLDSLVLVPTEGLNLGDNYSLKKEYTAVPGNPQASILKKYIFDKPVNFQGNLGIFYHPSQLNGNTESLLELANSWSDESTFVTMTGSTRDLGMHFVSKDVADLDIRMVTLVNAESALPVTLVEFEAEKMERSVKLNWKTSSETNSDFFEIQRSRNARDWTALGRVQSAGESKEQVIYNYPDDAPNAGSNYYRLKMVDRDGTFAFSQIRMVDWNGSALAVFPNPATDQLEMDVKDWSKVARVKVMNASGRVVEERWPVSGVMDKHMTLTAFKPGNYILQVEYRDGSSERTHFVKY